jgi:hypothetical protein
MTTPTKLLSHRTFNQIAMVFPSGALAPYSRSAVKQSLSPEF